VVVQPEELAREKALVLQAELDPLGYDALEELGGGCDPGRAITVTPAPG
jgi:hypothetical protein